MPGPEEYLVCPLRPGNPRIPLPVCRRCPKKRRCPAWRHYRQPALFPDLYRFQKE